MTEKEREKRERHSERERKGEKYLAMPGLGIEVVFRLLERGRLQGCFESQFPRDFSTFGDKSPQNGSKNVPVSPKRTLPSGLGFQVQRLGFRAEDLKLGIRV